MKFLQNPTVLKDTAQAPHLTVSLKTPAPVARVPARGARYGCRAMPPPPKLSWAFGIPSRRTRAVRAPLRLPGRASPEVGARLGGLPSLTLRAASRGPQTPGADGGAQRPGAPLGRRVRGTARLKCAPGAPRRVAGRSRPAPESTPPPRRLPPAGRAGERAGSFSTRALGDFFHVSARGPPRAPGGWRQSRGARRGRWEGTPEDPRRRAARGGTAECRGGPRALQEGEAESQGY